MAGKLESITANLFKTRDELSFRNIRFRLLPVLLVFPLSVIVGSLRYFDHGIALAGFQSLELAFLFLGLGWLVMMIVPSRFVITTLRTAVVASIIIEMLLLFIPFGFQRVVLYMAFKFLNGLCAACAFYLFCFMLNNVERLVGMALIQLYYVFFYVTWIELSSVYAANNTAVAVISALLYVIVVFLCRIQTDAPAAISNGTKSGLPFIMILSIVYHMITCTVNYIEWTNTGLSPLAFGSGTFAAIGVIFIIQLRKGLNALYTLLMFLVLTLLGLGILLYNTQFTFALGSFIYGLGDSLGYIVVYYICAGVIKQSQSLKYFRFFCLAFFVKYSVITELFSYLFTFFDGPDKFLAFGVVLVLASLCLLAFPFMQKRLFQADWTDGLHLRDLKEYSRPFAQTEELNLKEQLNLTSREEEIFTMLLRGSAPKEIAYTLKISYDTVHFHQKNLYRKLKVQSRAELFARYSSTQIDGLVRQ